MVCPFTVVVFAHDLKRIGDVSQLQNKVIEVHGPVKEYDGRPEIVLQQLRQLGGEGLGIPRLPKNYDVENKGHYSAGSFSLPKPPYTTHKKKLSRPTPIRLRFPALLNSPAPPITGARFLDPRPKACSQTPTTDEIRDMGYYDRSETSSSAIVQRRSPMSEKSQSLKQSIPPDTRNANLRLQMESLFTSG
jgi:hypothetical protein